MTEKEIKKLEKMVYNLQKIIDDQTGKNDKRSNGQLVEVQEHFYSSDWPRNYGHDFDQVRYLTASAFNVHKLSSLDEEELKMAKGFATELSDFLSQLYVKYHEQRKDYIEEKMKIDGTWCY